MGRKGRRYFLASRTEPPLVYCAWCDGVFHPEDFICQSVLTHALAEATGYLHVCPCRKCWRARQEGREPA